MKRISAMLMLSAMLMVSTVTLAASAGAQDPEVLVKGESEFNNVVVVDNSAAAEPELAFTGTSTDQTVKLAFGFVIVGAALLFVAKTRSRDDATV